MVPRGAPDASAANIAMPTQAMTFPAFVGPASARPQVTPPVMMKLSAAPSSARPTRRIAADTPGVPTKRCDKLAAGDEADHKRAETEALMHVQRQNRKRHADDQEPMNTTLMIGNSA